METDRRAEARRLRESGMTFKEIGLRLGISRERARQYIRGNPKVLKIDTASKAMLRISEAALLLGIGANTLRRWCNQGVLPSYRICERGDRRIKREDLKNFLEDARQIERRA